MPVQAADHRKPSRQLADVLSIGDVVRFVDAGADIALTTIETFSSRMPKSNPTPNAPAEPSYEDALAELERLVATMEGGQLPLDRLMQAYQRGAELLALCRQRLNAVEQQVKVLEDGQLKPWVGS